ncbi:MAG: DUF2092 domain-containing protein [Armatimonadetes bacterium]|nr:DUF2092 domain-containing protein [Armatimonadota bacterium]
MKASWDVHGGSRRAYWSLAAASLMLAGLSARGGHAESAKKVVEDMLKTYQQMSSLEETTSIECIREAPGQSMKVSASTRIAYKKPDRVIYEAKSGGGTTEVLSDGKKVWTYVSTVNQYRETSVPARIALGPCIPAEVRTSNDGLAFLRGDNPVKGAKSVKLLGSRRVGKATTRLVEIQGKISSCSVKNIPSTLRLWIGQKDHLLYKSEWILTVQQQTAGAQAGQGAKSTTRVAETHSNIKVNGTPKDSAFRFHPPKGAKKVDKFSSGCGMH